MASEPNRQSSNMGADFDALTSGTSMDPATVESLLRRLLKRVEDSEQRYSQALDDLHARLDQLSQSAGQTLPSASLEQAETLARLHSQVSDLAKTFEDSHRASPQIDEFAELGKTLSASAGFGSTTKPSAFESTPEKAFPDFGYSAPRSQMPLMPMLEQDEAELDKRLIAMAHRLEHSIETAMPATALEALNAKMDEIASRFETALNETVKRENLETLERQISDMGQQLNRAEHDLARISGIEAQLTRIIERFEETPAQIEQAATRAAAEAFRLSGAEMKPTAAERLEAIHRDIVAMNERGQTTDDRLADTMAAVHKSLQQLVQQVEKGSRPAPSMPAEAMPKRHAGDAPYADAKIEPSEQASESIEKQVPRRESLRSRLGAALSDLPEGEARPSSRARPQRGEEAKDLDGPAQQDAAFEDADDFVASARRAAQTAAAKAEERDNGKSRKTERASAASVVAPLEPQGRRKRPLLIILAAVLLMISAALFYGRLKSKPQPQPTPPAAEQSAPAPAAPVPPGAPAGGTVTPERSGQSGVPPMPAKPHGTQPPTRSGESDIAPPVTVGDVEIDMAPDAASASDAAVAAPEAVVGPADIDATTEIAKTAPLRTGSADPEISAPVQPASLKTNDATAFPAGVSVTIVEPQTTPALPKDGNQAVPASLPLPAQSVGPLSLRQAAANGDAKAQYAIGTRYAQGEGVPRDAVQAATWFGLAASAGLAPAQYRLGVLYERGEGIAKDHAKARDWYARAAEQGNVKAMHNLAVAESGRKGETPNYAIAAKWFGEAAARGLSDSQFNLGILAEHGLGTRKNLMEAYKWFALAAANGDAEAVKRRDLVKLQMPAEVVAQADRIIDSWKPVAVNAEANDVAEPPSWHAEAASPNKELVSRTQGLLNKLGYDVGAPDGQLGDRTRDAIRKFQQRNGLDETGEVSVPLVTKLERLTS